MLPIANDPFPSLRITNVRVGAASPTVTCPKSTVPSPLVSEPLLNSTVISGDFFALPWPFPLSPPPSFFSATTPVCAGRSAPIGSVMELSNRRRSRASMAGGAVSWCIVLFSRRISHPSLL